MSLDPLRDLHPPRLPANVAALGWPEVLAGFGFGLLLALVLFTLLRPALSPKAKPDLETTLAALNALPAEDRLVAQARLLDRLGERLPPEASAGLYRPGAPMPQLEPLIRAAWRKAPPRV